jgi:hemerythrin-like domain-containing protein
MEIRDHLIIMIDRVEYYLTKEIERNLSGFGDKCYRSLYDKVVECINARKEIDYQPYQSVEALLSDHGYDRDFIEKFLIRANCHG